MLGEKGKTPALLLPRLLLNQDAFPQLCFFVVVVAGFFVISPDNSYSEFPR